jgi:hypothetical protein
LRRFSIRERKISSHCHEPCPGALELIDAKNLKTIQEEEGGKRFVR